MLPAVGEQAPRTASSPLALSSPLNSGPSRCMTDSLTDEADAGVTWLLCLCEVPERPDEASGVRGVLCFASVAALISDEASAGVTGLLCLCGGPEKAGV